MAVAGLAMAALTKGPLGVALPLAGFALFLLRQRRGWLLVSREAGLAVAVVLALAFAYLAGVVAVEGWGFVRSVAVDQIWVRAVRSVDLSEPAYAYVPMLAAALLPWSVVLAWLIWRGVSQLGWPPAFLHQAGASPCAVLSVGLRSWQFGGNFGAGLQDRFPAGAASGSCCPDYRGWD